MTDNTELIKALRYCIDGTCGNCPYVEKCKKNGRAMDQLHDDAAAAIEELQAENKQFREGIVITARDKLRVDEKVKVLQAEVDALYRIMIRGQMEVQE